MPSFGNTSLRRLDECHDDIQVVFDAAIAVVDCTILCGHRGEEEQNEAFASGNSQVEFPLSTHNVIPSDGVDASPYPIPDRWGDIDMNARFCDIEHQMKERHKFYALAGTILGIASVLGIKIRWGGDWDGDGDFNDQSFDDLVHYERG